MSWFVGYIGDISKEIYDKFQQNFGKPNLIADDSFRIAYSGNNINYCDGLLAAGIFTDSANRIIAKPIFRDVAQFREDYKGNYACVAIQSDKLLIFNDILGIRELFLYKHKNFTIFSSSPEFISKLIGFKLNIQSFAGRWLLENQFGYSSLYDGVIRLTSSSYIEIEINSNYATIYNSVKFICNKSNADPTTLIIDKLRAINESNSKIIFMLSGGIDSRYLFALSLKSGIEFETMTIGPEEHPDNKYAKILSEKLKIQHKNIPILNDADKLIELLPDFVVKSRFFASASELNRKYIYSEYDFDNSIIIDGSFGEILRRGMYNKLHYQYSSAFLSKDKKQLAKCLRFFKGDIFINDFSEKLQSYAEIQIENSLRDIDFDSNSEIAYWLDILSVREKLLNFNALEQNRIDSFALNYCPFSQSDVINSAFSLEMNQRKNAKYIKNYIKNEFPELAKIPLVKGNVIVPFAFNTFSNKIIGKLKNKLGMKYKDNSTKFFIRSIKEYGVAQIESLKEYDFIDKTKLDKYIEMYKNNDYSSDLSLDWFLTFAVFMNTNNTH